MHIHFKDSRIFTIFHLAKKAFSGYKLQVFILTILGFLGGILEGIGVNALIPLFSFAVGKQGADDPISRMIEKLFDIFHLHFSVFSLLFFISVLFVGKAILSIFLDYVRFKITYDYEEKLRQRVFSSAINSSWLHYTKQKLGYIETILMVDIPSASTMMMQISGIIITLTGLIIYVVVAINISFIVTLITLILGSIVFLVMKPLLFKTKIIAQKVTQTGKESSHHVSENIIGMKTVKTMSVGSHVGKKANLFFEKLKVFHVKRNIIKTISTSFIQPLGIIYICVLFAFTYRSSTFNFAALVAVVYLVHKMFTYIQQSQRSLQSIVDLAPHLLSALNFEEEAKKKEEQNSGQDSFVFKKKFEFKDISFSYEPNKPVLQNMNFTIQKGQLVGVIGPSGAGKTTMVDLMLRLLQPRSGKIMLDKKDISQITMHEWRKNIGYVSQDIFLMNDTIENNIRFYDKSIAKKEIIEAAKMANIYDFILSTSQGLQTVIGDRGIMLSGGQRQRIVIARVLARNPKLLILDEATSALDNESEKKIQKVIHNLKGKITVIAIAHRLSTVSNSDLLLAIEDGKIIERGNPKTLLKDKKSYFYRIYNTRK